MGTFRNVNSDFWKDPKVEDDFTPEDRYFFLYLLTNRHTNICGCYEISKRQISKEMGYTVDTIDNLIYRFKNIHQIIDYDSDTCEMLIINWHKYNWSKSERLITAVRRCADEIENDSFRTYIYDVLEHHLSGDKKYPIYTQRYTVSDRVTDTVSPYGIEYSMDTRNLVTSNNVTSDEVTNNSVANNKSPRKKEPKHKYGEYQHVLLTDREYERLVSEYGEAFIKDRIRNLDEYLQNNRSKHYDDHNLTIRNWIRRDKEKAPPQNSFGYNHEKSGGGEYIITDEERRRSL